MELKLKNWREFDTMRHKIKTSLVLCLSPKQFIIGEEWNNFVNGLTEYLIEIKVMLTQEFQT